MTGFVNLLNPRDIASSHPEDATGAARGVVDALCFHCGLNVPRGKRFSVTLDGQSRPMCCVGCEAIAQSIIDAGFSSYYRERERYAAPTSLPPTASGSGFDSLQSAKAPSATRELTADQDTQTADYFVDGITCGACCWLAESALLQLAGVRTASVNAATHYATISWDGQETPTQVFQQALARFGFSLHPASDPKTLEVRRHAQRRSLMELGVALLSMMQVMMFTVPLYGSAGADVDEGTRQLLAWAAMVLTLPAVLFSSRRFFAGAWRDLATLRWTHISMDLPVSIAIVTGFGTSVVALVQGLSETYFDSVSMFIFLLLCARHLEVAARGKSLACIERLTSALPIDATRMPLYPHTRLTERVSASTLAVGDVVRIAPGEIAPADGVIVEGVGEFDEALLTGESSPITRGVSDAILSGSMNVGDAVLVRMNRVGQQTLAATLRTLTEHALAARPRLVQTTDAIARWIIPTTFVAAIGAALSWLLIDPAMSAPVALAIIAVACPCALALAVPTTQAIATARLAQDGLLILRPDTLARLAAATDIVFDKTGTLTSGKPTVSRVMTCAPYQIADALRAAVALENGSAHPYAKAFVRALTEQAQGASIPELKEARHYAGQGVEGTLPDGIYRLGSRAFVGDITSAWPNLNDAAAASVFLARNNMLLAAFEISDALQESAANAVSTLSARGLRVHLLSGDTSARVAKVADALSLPAARVRAHCTPEAKAAYVEGLSATGAKTITVGDGLNDALVMAKAGVSVAMGTGADVTRLTADAVLMRSDLRVLAMAHDVAIASERIIKQNIVWAILYNLVALPAAMLGYLSPAWAALGMATSSLLVVTNSVRLFWSTRTEK